MEGLELAAAFSCAPNSLGLCGPKHFNSTTKKALENTLKKFFAPYAYFSLIADANGLSPFDYEVVEAFWLGNKCLDAINRDDISSLITKKFAGKNRLSPARASSLASNLPHRIFPHHSFHVFYIGSVTGVLKGTQKELDSCRVSWGEVIDSSAKLFKVNYSPIKRTKLRKALSASGNPIGFTDTIKNKKTLALAPQKIASWQAWQNRPLPHTGSIISSHWGIACVPLSRQQQKNLEKYTRLNMELYPLRPGA